MDAAFDDRQFGAGDDPVEAEDRTDRGEARAGLAHMVLQREALEAPAVDAPLVEIAHHDGGQRLFEVAQRAEHRLRLPLAPEADQPQMHADDAQPLRPDLEIGQHRAARLQRREGDGTLREHFDILANENHVAVPAHAPRPHAESHRAVVRLVFEGGGAERGDTGAKAAIDLLQRHDIRIKLLEHRQNSLRTPPEIGADGFLDIVGRHRNHDRPVSPKQTSGKRRSEAKMVFQSAQTSPPAQQRPSSQPV
ncbi:hypothetical protein [Devosia sp. DBB001]|nr:hypothetical protein [Devosia sp. DBB001]